MRKIVLLCSFGMSTSLLVTRMQEAAAAQSYDCEIEATSIAEVANVADTADILLLGPQVRFQRGKVEEQASCPVEVIEATAYGRMDGEAVIAKVKEILGD